jgi:hypothetical protein
MSERVSLGAAGQRLGVSGGDIRRAGYTTVTASRLGAWEHEPPAWLRKARARERRPGPRRVQVSCCVCGGVRGARSNLVEGYTHLVCGGAAGAGNDRRSPAGQAWFLCAPSTWPDTSTGTSTGSPQPRSAPAFTGLLLWLAPAS